MPQLTIVPHGGAAAVVLPPEILEAIGLQVGDVVDVTVGERQLILRSVGEASRRELLETITKEVFERRKDAYERLA